MIYMSFSPELTGSFISSPVFSHEETGCQRTPVLWWGPLASVQVQSAAEALTPHPHLARLQEGDPRRGVVGTGVEPQHGSPSSFLRLFICLEGRTPTPGNVEGPAPLRPLRHSTFGPWRYPGFWFGLFCGRRLAFGRVEMIRNLENPCQENVMALTHSAEGRGHGGRNSHTRGAHASDPFQIT